MSAAVMMSETVFSTPRHDNNDDPTVIIPSTPNKKTKSFELHFDESVMTPSKSFRCEKKYKPFPTKLRRNISNVNGVNTTPKTNINNTATIVSRKIPILSPIPTEPRKTRLMIDSFDGILSEKLNQDFEIYSPLSDIESISPLSDISSCSPCIEIKKPMDFNSIPSLPWNPNGRLSLYQRDEYSMNQSNQHTSNIIPSTLIELQTITTSTSTKDITSDENGNDDKMFLLELPPLGKKIKTTVLSTPLHRSKSPIKPIIKNDSKSLNLIVSSGNGSLDDATIYATEINASSNHEATTNTKESNSTIPIIRNVWERITIPVNHEIKERHKRLRSSYFGEFYNLDESSKLQEDDYAMIRGYEFEIKSNKDLPTATITNRVNKNVRWNTPLY
ncbi:superficial pseudohyphal growth protein 1 [Monosporozyma unispora]|nr:hypothetical protein C6P44_003056 [Kazachstania unispora]